MAAKHPRFHLHFTPTSASWLNMVERFFRDLTVNRLRRGVFHSLPELVAALQQYIATYNKEPKPYVWTAKASDILAKVQRARAKTQPSGEGALIRAHYTSKEMASMITEDDADGERFRQQPSSGWRRLCSALKQNVPPDVAWS